MSVANRLEVIKKTSLDVKEKIDDITQRDRRIEIATVRPETYAADLYRLMEDFANTANPVLKELGLDKESISQDIEEYVKILEDNHKELYFASINLDAKYEKNRQMLLNIGNWLSRLILSIEKVLAYLDTGVEKKELEALFSIVDGTDLPNQKKKELKDEFLRVLNKLNKNC